ncbi:hypothetical protein BDV12DRAFT_194498 [Aspergillus spectabilis]
MVAEGDRSFAVLGAVYIGAVAVVAEVQALWVEALGLNGEGQEGPLARAESVLCFKPGDPVAWL